MSKRTCQLCEHDGTVFPLTWLTGDADTLICNRCYKLIWRIIEEAIEKMIAPDSRIRRPNDY